MESAKSSSISRRSLNLSLIDAFFFSIMVGAGETYLPAYALSIGMSEVMAGFFSTLPLIGGAIVQLIAPFAIVRVGSIKKWVTGSAILQAAAFLPLIYFSANEVPHFSILFLIASIYFAAGFSAAPSWNFWMGHLVPESISGKYFTKRLRLSQVGILLGLVGGGVCLHYQVKFGIFTSVFSVLFMVAFFCRVISALMLALKNYSPHWKYKTPAVSLHKIVDSFVRHPEYRSFFGFLFVFYIVIFISSPFVTPYLLEKLHLSYSDYMWALGGLFVAKILTLPIANSLAKKYGLKTVFYLGIIGISPLPALWSLSDKLWFVVLLQAMSGAFWALFEVSLAVIFFNQVKAEEKIPVLTLYNFFNALALIMGTVIGGQVLEYLDETLEGYYWIFIGGAFLRCLLALIFIVRTKIQVKFISASIYESLGQGGVTGAVPNRTRTT